MAVVPYHEKSLNAVSLVPDELEVQINGLFPYYNMTNQLKLSLFF